MRDRLQEGILHPGQAGSDQERAVELASSIRDSLWERLLPFWYRSAVLPEGRGFWPSLARDGTRIGDGCHSIVSVARLVYSFSVAAELSGEEKYLSCALDGVRQLRRYYNAGSGGWNWKVSPGGECLEPALRPYGVVFAVYALASCGRVGEVPELVELAGASFRQLWENGREPTLGGFWHELTPDWTPAARYHRLDTHLHAMEACCALLAATGDPFWRKCWLELTLLVSGRAFDPEYGCVREQFLPDWSENLNATGGQINYGHNLETAWFLGQAADVLEEPGLADLGRRLLDFVLEEEVQGDGSYGEREEHGEKEMKQEAGAERNRRAIFGGFRTSGIPARRHTHTLTPLHTHTPPHPPTDYVWWVQAEGLGALAHFYRRRPSRALLHRLEALWSYIQAAFDDPLYGGWYHTVSPDGTPLDDRKGSDWKAAYHVVQACAHAAASLDGKQPPTGL